MGSTLSMGRHRNRDPGRGAVGAALPNFGLAFMPSTQPTNHGQPRGLSWDPPASLAGDVIPGASRSPVYRWRTLRLPVPGPAAQVDATAECHRGYVRWDYPIAPRACHSATAQVKRPRNPPRGRRWFRVRTAREIRANECPDWISPIEPGSGDRDRSPLRTQSELREPAPRDRRSSGCTGSPLPRASRRDRARGEACT